MNMVKYFFLLFVICFQSAISFSQDTRKINSDKSHVFSFYTGYSKYIERDDAMSPFKYRGYSLPLEVTYRYDGAKCRQIFYANFDKLKLLSSLPNYENAGLSHYVQNTNIQIGYSYMYRLFRLAKFQTDIYFGGEINSLLNLRRHAYINNNEFLMLDQFSSIGLKALIEKRFSNDKQVATLNINIPILSYALMKNTYNAYNGDKIDPLMNYSGNMLLYLAKNGDFVSLNRLVYFKTEFSFIQFISNHIGVECKLSLRYYQFTQYEDMNYSKNLQSQILIGIVGKL